MEGDDGSGPPRRTLGGVKKPKFKPKPKARKKKSATAKAAASKPHAPAPSEQAPARRPRRQRPDLAALSGEVAFAGGQSSAASGQGRTLLSSSAPAPAKAAAAPPRPKGSGSTKPEAEQKAPTAEQDVPMEAQQPGEVADTDQEWPPPLVSSRPPVVLPFSTTNRKNVKEPPLGSEDGVFLLQLPNRLPLAMRGNNSGDTPTSEEAGSAGGKKKDGESTVGELTRQDLDDLYTIHGESRKRFDALKSVPTGSIGKLKVHRSGKKTLEIGGAQYIINPATPSQHYQEVVAINRENKEYVTLGAPSGQYVASPDINSLLSQWALRKQGDDQ